MFHSGFGMEKDQVYSTTVYVIITLVTNYLIIVPLSLIENLHGFRYISVIAMVSILYCAIVLLA